MERYRLHASRHGKHGPEVLCTKDHARNGLTCEGLSELLYDDQVSASLTSLGLGFNMLTDASVSLLLERAHAPTHALSLEEL
eukprot:2132619-Pleurochrysis_carterae.AAC.1